MKQTNAKTKSTMSTDKSASENEHSATEHKHYFPKRYLNKKYFDEYGCWAYNLELRQNWYRLMIIRDSEGLYTISITPHGGTVQLVDHVTSLPYAVDALQHLVENIDRHDVTIIGSGERMRVLA